MSTTKRDVVNTIKNRLVEIKPYIEEYKSLTKALEALGQSLPKSETVKQLIDEEQRPERQIIRRSTPVGRVPKAQRFDEIMTILYEHGEYLNLKQISDRSPSPSTPTAISHRIRDLQEDGFVQRFKDEKTGRTTIDGFYAFAITEKGRNAFEAVHPERKGGIKLHAGHGVVEPSR